jgi:hypothetical protein
MLFSSRRPRYRWAGGALPAQHSAACSTFILQQIIKCLCMFCKQALHAYGVCQGVLYRLGVIDRGNALTCVPAHTCCCLQALHQDKEHLQRQLLRCTPGEFDRLHNELLVAKRSTAELAIVQEQLARHKQLWSEAEQRLADLQVRAEMPGAKQPSCAGCLFCSKETGKHPGYCTDIPPCPLMHQLV